MTTPLLFPGFDGLMTLSRREGVDIRPTLLRVLTDLYVQASAHSDDEERQFVELTSRLIDEVDDATRAVVRARLAIYPGTPAAVLKRLGLQRTSANQVIPLAPEIPAPPPAATPLKASARIPAARAARAIETLEMAAFAADIENFTLELGEALILPWRLAAQLVNDPGGEPLACAAKALEMPSTVFQRVLLFLNPAVGSSVTHVYRLSRLYDRLHERSALIMLAAWRGSTMAVARAKYRPALYDDDRQRARSAPAQTRPAAQPPGAGGIVRNRSQSSGS